MTPATKKLTGLLLTLVVAAGIGFRLLSHQHEKMRTLKKQTEALENRDRQIEWERDRMLAEISAAESAITAVQRQSKYATTDSELGAWLSRVDRLKQRLRTAPEKKIPEMQFLSSNDWLSVTLDNPLNTDAKIRYALSQLRLMAKMKPQVAGNLAAALQAYGKSNNGLSPSDPRQLQPYLNPPLPDELLQRYEPAPEVPGQNDARDVIRPGLHLRGSGPIVLQEKAPVDDDYDTWIGFTKNKNWAVTEISQLATTVNQAMKSFAQANNGTNATTPEQLLPYLPTSIEPTRLKEYWEVSRR